MNEKIARFGKNRALIGVVSEPSGIDCSKPAFIFLNSGLIHRVGPFRFYTWASRMLSEEGYLGFRIDLSGKGDSPARKDVSSNKESVRKDASEAMDYLEERYSINQFIICGICTGADNTYEVGFNDDRVVGMVPVDGYAYKTLRFYARNYGPKIIRIGTWFRLLKRLVNRLRGKPDIVQIPASISENQMMFPDKHDYMQKMSDTLSRGTNIFIIMTGGWHMFYNYQDQFKDSFPELENHPGLKLNHFPESDHTFVLSADRKKILSEISRWTKSCF